jgi:hypothetical protein
MPWTAPLGVVSGVLKSACASNHSTPPGPWTDANPPIVPIATEWSPPRTSGTEPPSAADRTCSAIRSQVSRISVMKRAFSSPASIVSRTRV